MQPIVSVGAGEQVEARASALREMVRHETEQVNRRLSIQTQIQGFLFAALGFAWGKSEQLTHVLCSVGIAISILCLIALLASTAAIERIRKNWTETKPIGYKGPDILGYYPDRYSLTVYTCPENLLPIVFIVAWLYVLLGATY